MCILFSPLGWSYLKVEEDFKNFPSIYWLPKVHKKPYKFRFIVNYRSCSTKELFIRMTLVLQAIKTHVKKYCHKYTDIPGVKIDPAPGVTILH